MFPNLSQVNIYIRPGHTDMRKSINGLAMVVTEDMSFDPLNGSLYLFANKQRKIIKALYWDRNGFCLWQKKLEKHRFPWPKTDEAAREIDYSQLKMLLDGIDFWQAHTALKYSAVS